MPNQASNATALRSGGQVVRTYLSIMTGSVVWTATVSATPTYPAFSLAVTSVSGSHTNVKRGYRVVIETSGGAYKGTLNVRAAGTISSTALPVREVSKGHTNIVSGDVVKVFDDVLLADKLVSADATFAPDALTYSDQNSNPPPVVCSGGWWAGFLNSAGNADVPFVGSTSYAIDPDSAGGLTHLWTAPSGAFVTGTSASADPTVRWTAAGAYTVVHSVTDNDNSKSREQIVRVRVHSAADAPYECVIEQVEATEDAGWTATVQLFDALSISTLPDGAPVCLWTDEFVNGTEPAFGSQTAGRHHILMNGYVRRDTQLINADTPTLRLDIISGMARLDELPGFSKVMEYNQTPDAWSEIKTLTVKRAIVQILAFYTWAIESGIDLVFSGFSDAAYPAFYLQKQTPVGQLRELADSRDARVVCLKDGRIEIQLRPELTALGSRGAMTTTYTLTSEDIDAGDGGEGVTVTREHYRPIELFEGQGLTSATTANASTPVFSRWPGTPGYGSNAQTAERMIADSQVTLNERTGRRGAAVDRVYQNGSSGMTHAPEAELNLRGSYWRIMDFHREWLSLSFDATSNLRGTDLSALRWRLVSIAVAFEDMTARTTVRLQAETNAEAGVTYYPPASDTSFIDWTPPEYVPGYGGDPLLIPNIPPGSNILPTRIWAVGVDEAAGVTDIRRADGIDATSGAVTWSANVNDGNVDGTGQWGCSDTWRYVRKFILTSLGLYKTDDLYATTPVFSLVANNATLFGNSSRLGLSVHATIHRQGCLLIPCGTNMVARTVDYGQNWTQVRVDPSTTDSYGTTTASGFSIAFAERSPGVVFASYTNDAGDLALSISKDYGATWPTQGVVNFAGFFVQPNLFVPYTRVDGTPNRAGTGTTGTVVYAINKTFYVSEVNNTTVEEGFFADLSSVIGTFPYDDFQRQSRNPIHVSSDGQYMAVAVPISSAGATGSSIFYGPLDSLQKFTPTKVDFNAGSSGPNVNGYSTYSNQALLLFAKGSNGVSFNGDAGLLYMSLDGGATWADIGPGFTGGRCAYAEFDLSAVQ